MRVFIGLKVPVASMPHYNTLQKYLKTAFESHNIRAQFQHPEDFHITIQYIGEVSPQQLDSINFIDEVGKVFAKSELMVSGLGSFPSLEKSRGLWMGVKNSPALEFLQHNVKEKVLALNLPMDKKPFVPHITITSFAQPTNLGPIMAQIYSKFSAFEFIPSSLNLYQSDTGPGQPYNIIKGIKLTEREHDVFGNEKFR